MIAPVVRSVRIFPLSIPLRRRVEHAASSRAISNPVVVAVELQNGVTGFGETLPRAYVTGESVESVVAAIQSTFVSSLMSFHPLSFGDAIDALEALPWRDEAGRCVPAARAAVELALLDASMRSFHRGVDAVVRFLDLSDFEAPGSLPRIRFSGVLANPVLTSMRRTLRLLYWGGVRHYKVKVGFDGDRELVHSAVAYLFRSIAGGSATLRVDANGGWTVERAEEWIRAARDLPIAAIEQPLAPHDDHMLPRLKSLIRELHGEGGPLLMHDESLVTLEDGRRLCEMGVADALNLRLSKNGGIVPSLRLAALAHRQGAVIQLGCMVGETSILSAAALRFLSVCPKVRWADGCFGTYLLARDVGRRSLRFGLGGRPPLVRGHGLCEGIEESTLAELSESRPMVINL